MSRAGCADCARSPLTGGPGPRHPVFAEGRHRSDVIAGTAPATPRGGEQHVSQSLASVLGVEAAVTRVCRLGGEAAVTRVCRMAGRRSARESAPARAAQLARRGVPDRAQRSSSGSRSRGTGRAGIRSSPGGFEHRTLLWLVRANEKTASTRENIVIPTTSVEVMGVSSNPSWPADLGKCALKV